jgi:hypothetical protein
MVLTSLSCLVALSPLFLLPFQLNPFSFPPLFLLQSQRDGAREKVRRVVSSREEKEALAAKLAGEVEQQVEARIEEVGQALATERREARLAQDRERDKVSEPWGGVGGWYLDGRMRGDAWKCQEV